MTLVVDVTCILIMAASACGLVACVRGARRPRVPEPLAEPICPLDQEAPRRRGSIPAPPPPPPPGRNPITGKVSPRPAKPKEYKTC